MAKINLLPASVYNRIAAGEVVDRPYSVVKELVENALDAGARNIEIRIEQGGKQLIRVTDDGSGIARDDLHAAFLPHATSKIAKAADLDTILTLGFRGEALSSIGSVAEVTIVSRVEAEPAHRIVCKGGEIGQIVECGGALGTEVSVETLFFNTPARRKFLKSDKAEESDVTNLVSRFLLGNPEISFVYYADGKKLLQSFGGGLEEAMTAVYGAAILNNCIPVDAEKHGIRLRGYIGNQNYFKANRSYQSTFINGRYVTNETLRMALHNAYGSYMMKRQYPFYVLFFTIPPEVVDVNVHPNKADVRFANNQVIYGSVYSVISAVLDGSAQALDYVREEATVKSTYPEAPKAPAPTTPSAPFVSPAPIVQSSAAKKPMSDVQPAYRADFTAEDARREIARSKPKFYAPLPFEEVRKENRMEAHAPVEPIEQKEDAFEENKRYLKELEAKKAKQGKISIEECVFRGILFQTYLLYERGEDVYLIDQHAAHERLIFDRLKEKTETRSIVVQPMIVPFLVHTNAAESEFLNSNAEHIRSLGFEIEAFGINCFKVSAVPADLGEIDLQAFFDDILSHISDFKGIRLSELLRDKLASAACKAAIKGGMRLTEQEVAALFAEMDGEMGLKCPHGRPVVVRLTKTEIEKMFKRIV